MFDERLECELSSVEKNGGVLCPHEEQIKGKGEQKGKNNWKTRKLKPYVRTYFRKISR